MKRREVKESSSVQRQREAYRLASDVGRQTIRWFAAAERLTLDATLLLLLTLTGCAAASPVATMTHPPRHSVPLPAPAEAMAQPPAPAEVAAGVSAMPPGLAIGGPTDLHHDESAGVIRYELSAPAHIRLRVGLQDGALMATLLDWELREAGAHEEPWSGYDPAGFFRLSRHPQMHIAIETLAGSKHAAHPRAECHEPGVRLSTPGVEPAASLVVTGETLPVRVELAPADEKRLIATRFEIMLYLDGQFIHEEEDAMTPLNYAVPLAGVAPGTHLVTVNVQDYEGHIGVAHLLFERKGLPS